MAVGNVVADGYLQVANFVTDQTGPRGEPASEIFFEGRLLEWGFDEIAHRVFGEIQEHSLHVLATDCTRPGVYRPADLGLVLRFDVLASHSGNSL
jgi:hypothetical protein